MLELDPGESRRGLTDYVRYLELPGSTSETLSAALATPRSEYATIEQRFIDFGSTPNTIWLSLRLHNTGARDGEWRLSFNVRFMTELLVYQSGTADGGGTADRSGTDTVSGARSGDGAVILDQRADSTFDERPEAHRLLSVPFAVSAGGVSELLIGYNSKGATGLPLSIETAASYAERYSFEDAVNLACYSIVGFLALLSALQAVVLSQRQLVSYAAYLAATLLYIVHMDGLSFQYVWPGQPLWNSYAAIPLGSIMSVAAVNFGRTFVETRTVAPVFDKLMLALIAVAVAIPFAGFWAGEATLKAVSYLIASLAAGFCLIAAVLAQLRNRPAMRFFMIGWIGVFFGVALTSIVNNFPGIVPRNVATAIPKVTIVFDTLMFYMALADRARAWRRERDAAARRELDAIRAQQETREQLHDSERERLEALLLAQAKSQQLAMASHDICQPLTALSVALERLIANENPEAPVSKGVRQSLDYLRQLAEEYSAERSTRLAPVPHSAPGAREPGHDNASFDMADLLLNLDLMFRDEAEADGLDFRCRPSSVRVAGDAMAAMRLASNLVANAIKYTKKGKVLVGCRRRPSHVTLVVADTGPGMAADELARVLKPRERGTAADNVAGHGLGLAIVTALVADNGYGFYCDSVPGRGTAFFVDLPIAWPDASTRAA